MIALPVSGSVGCSHQITIASHNASAQNATCPTSLGETASNLLRGNTRIIESKLTDRFLVSTLVQKISWVKTEILNIDIFSRNFIFTTSNTVGLKSEEKLLKNILLAATQKTTYIKSQIFPKLVSIYGRPTSRS